MPPKPTTTKPPGNTSTADPNLRTLIDLTKTTQTLLTHYLSSLTHSSTSNTASSTTTTPPPNPLDILKPTTTLLKSHTTTLSLLLLTPPFSPTAISKKIGDVSASVLSAMVSAATPTTTASVSGILNAELRAQVRRVLGAWGEVLGCVLSVAEDRASHGGGDSKEEVSESQRNDILASTGVVWESCDALLKVCDSGIVGVVVKKAEEWRSVLLDAAQELKEWGEEVDDDDEDGFVGSDDEDEIFGAENKLGKDDVELKKLLDASVKKLKMVGVLYQALVKRRLKTFPKGMPENSAKDENTRTLELLMGTLRAIPESVDDLASAFYDLDEEEAKTLLEKCCSDAKEAAVLVEKNWEGKEDEFTVWSAKWKDAVEAS